MIRYKHIDSSITTFTALLASDNITSIINVGAITKIELFAFEDNLTSIYGSYSPDDQKTFETDYSLDQVTVNSYLSQKQTIDQLSDEEKREALQDFDLELDQLEVGLILLIPDYAIRQENIIVQSNQNVDQESFKEFYVNELRRLETDPEYRPIIEELDGNLGVVKKMLPQQTVWVYCKTLEELIDITPFITELSITNTVNGGSWTIVLSPVISKYVREWQMSGVEEFGDNVFAKGNNDERFYFVDIIQPNDIIFIRFETLKNEVKQRVLKNDNFTVPLSQLSRGIYDMIGLVDSAEIFNDKQSNNVTISLEGRDLVKLLIEDGTYFFATEYIPGGIFVQNQDVNARDLAINRIDGKLYQLSLASVKSIDFSLKFIINALSNIRICDDNVFSSYSKAIKVTGYDTLKNKFTVQNEDIRSKRYEIEFQDEDHTQFKLTEQPMSGIWQIVKLVVDKNIENYRQVDATLGNEMGSILNAVKKVCQEPFCEFFTDTYSNQFFFIARRPPFDYAGYKALSDVAVTINAEDVISYNFRFSDQEVYSWFRLLPQGVVDEFGIDSVWAYLKAIKFEEFSKFYGDKCYNQVSNYLHYQDIEGANKILNINSVTKQFIRDFKYLIEFNQYNAFVRSGQIIMNGDRRVKRGTVVYFELTDELCYVDAVNQNYSVSDTSIDRTTVLQVSKCMVKEYLEYYFKIINLPDKEFDKVNVSYIEFVDFMTNWKVDADYFDFFVKRKQFVKGQSI